MSRCLLLVLGLLAVALPAPARPVTDSAGRTVEVPETIDRVYAAGCATLAVLLKDGRTLASGPPHAALTEDTLSELYGVATRVERLADGQCICLPRPGA